MGWFVNILNNQGDVSLKCFVRGSLIALNSSLFVGMTSEGECLK